MESGGFSRETGTIDTHHLHLAVCTEYVLSALGVRVFLPLSFREHIVVLRPKVTLEVPSGPVLGLPLAPLAIANVADVFETADSLLAKSTL